MQGVKRPERLALKMKVLSLFLGCAVFLVLLQCATSQCNTTQDCRPDIVSFTGNFSENAIRCVGERCVCNTCFETGTDGNCALRSGCWQLVSSEGFSECVMAGNGGLFPTSSAILFGVSAVLFIVPLLLAGILGLAMVVCYKQCNEMEIPKRVITPLLVVAIACFWTISVVLILAGIIVSSTAESTCLQQVAS